MGSGCSVDQEDGDSVAIRGRISAAVETTARPQLQQQPPSNNCPSLVRPLCLEGGCNSPRNDEGHTLVSQDDRRSEQVLSVEYLTRATNHSMSHSTSHSSGVDWRIAELDAMGRGVVHASPAPWGVSTRQTRPSPESEVHSSHNNTRDLPVVGASLDVRHLTAQPSCPSQLSCGTGDLEDDDILCDRDDDPPMIADEPGGHVARLPLWKKRNSAQLNPSIHSARKSVVSFSECVSVHYDAPPADDVALDEDHEHHRVSCDDADDDDAAGSLSFDFSGSAPTVAQIGVHGGAINGTAFSQADPPTSFMHRLHHVSETGAVDDQDHSDMITSPSGSLAPPSSHLPHTPLLRLHQMLNRSTAAASDSASVATLVPLGTSLTAGDAMSTCSSRQQPQVVVVHLVDSSSHRIQLARPRL